MLTALLVFSAASAMTWILIPGVRQVAFHYQSTMDLPDDRRIHKKAIPRIGGLAMLGAFTLVLLAGRELLYPALELRPLLGILGAALVGALMGFRDDLYGLNALRKLALQTLATGLLFLAGFRIERMVFPFFWSVSFPIWISLLATFFWVAATMNAINLIDGIDGSAAGISLIAALGMSVVAVRTDNAAALLVAVVLAGVCLGFLYHNFYPASIFMGDCGSMFLGAALAGLGLLLTRNGATTGSMWIPITMLTLPFLDTLLAIIRRASRGQSIYTADREHLHHQLLDFGLSQRQVALIFYGVSIIMTIVAILCFNGTDTSAMSIIALIGLLLLSGGSILFHIHKVTISDRSGIPGIKQMPLEPPKSSIRNSQPPIPIDISHPDGYNSPSSEVTSPEDG